MNTWPQLSSFGMPSVAHGRKPLRRSEIAAGEWWPADYAGKPGFWAEYTTNPSQGGTDSYAFLPKQYKGTDYTKLQIPSTTVYTACWPRFRPTCMSSRQ